MSMDTFVALFEHYVVEGRYLISSMEHGGGNLPDKYWRFLGFVKLPSNSIIGEKMKQEVPIEVSEEMVDIVPELNQLVKREEKND